MLFFSQGTFFAHHCIIIMVIVSTLSIKMLWKWYKNRKFKKVQNRRKHKTVEVKTWRLRENPTTPIKESFQKSNKLNFFSNPQNMNESALNLNM